MEIRRNTLKHYRDTSYTKMQHHTNALYLFKSLNVTTTILSVVLVSFTGIANNVNAINGEEDKVTKIIFSCLLYMSLVITGLQKIFKLDQKVEQHRSSMQRYSIFYETIMDYSQEGRQIDEFVSRNFQLLDSTSPDIPDFIQKKIVECPDDIIVTRVDTIEADNALNFEMKRMTNRHN